jgi:hypothetical protein
MMAADAIAVAVVSAMVAFSVVTLGIFAGSHIRALAGLYDMVEMFAEWNQGNDNRLYFY